MNARSVLVVALVTATTVACKKTSTTAPEPSGSNVASGARASADAAPQPPAADASGSGSAVDAAAAVDAPAAAGDAAAVESRARAALEAQLATFPDKHDALIATFTSAALVLAPKAREVANTSNELATKIPGMEGPEEKLVKRTIDRLFAGGARGMSWLAGDVTLEIDRPGGAIKKTLRVLELLDGSAGWKVAAASFGNVSPTLHPLRDMGTMPTTSAAGPLATLLTSPGDAAAALADDPNVVVMGTAEKEYAVGPAAAKALLESWKKLQLTIDKTNVLEVRTADWGFALGYVNLAGKDGAPPLRMTGLLIAIPSGDSWSVVGVHYLPI